LFEQSIKAQYRPIIVHPKIAYIKYPDSVHMMLHQAASVSFS